MTPLDKDISRETTIRVDEREIQITLTPTQKISMKLKGMKTGSVEIGIGELYGQLKGSPSKPEAKVERPKPSGLDISSYKEDDKYLISLHEIRASMMVSDMELACKHQFERFLVGLINERKTK